MPELITIGEALIEFSREADGRYRPSVAGDAFNTLFYASRLGIHGGFVSATGRDPFAPLLAQAFTDADIDVSHVPEFGDLTNGLYFIETDAHGERSFHFRRENSAATRMLERCDMLMLTEYIASSQYFLLTGVALAVLRRSWDMLKTLLETIHAHTTIVFDTNYRPQMWESPEEYRRAIEEHILPYTHIFLPTDNDLELTIRESPESLFAKLYRQGIRTIIMKAGAKGCAVWTGDECEWYPIPEHVAVVDTTGAGDAFNAGYLVGEIRGYRTHETCELAHRTAAAALSVRGAINTEFRPIGN